jgi:Spy/CpxP family protein refolding chaperone
MVRSFVAGVVVVGMLVSGAVFAQGPRAGGPGGGQGRAGGLGRGGVAGLPLAGLSLTQAQQDVIADIRERGRVQLQEVEARIQSEILSVLTPAQQQQVKAAQAERQQRRAEGDARRKPRQQ